MVAMHPPWSTAMSTITEPSFICATISFVTSWGARAPATRTAPISRSARRTTWSTLKLFDISVTACPRKRSSTCRSRSRFTSRIETSAPSPTAVLAALSPAVPGPEDHDVARRDARHARQEDTAAAVRPAEIEGPLLDGEAARNLAHRREQWEAPVGALDRLVRDRDGARVAERAGQLGRRRQVEVREEDLAGPEALAFRGQRLLHLEHQLGALPDVVHRDQLGTDRGVLVVADPAPRAGAALDQHPVRRLGQGTRAGRGERDALLARFGLARHPDDHRGSFVTEEPPVARKARIRRLTRSGCSFTTQCDPSGIRSIVRSGTKRSSPSRFPVSSARSCSPQITSVGTRTVSRDASPPKPCVGSPSPAGP